MKYFLILLLLSTQAHADTKWINGIQYGNVCRSGNIFSVRFNFQYWGHVGSVCELLTAEGYSLGKGRITYE